MLNVSGVLPKHGHVQCQRSPPRISSCSMSAETFPDTTMFNVSGVIPINRHVQCQHIPQWTPPCSMSAYSSTDTAMFNFSGDLHGHRHVQFQRRPPRTPPYPMSAECNTLIDSNTSAAQKQNTLDAKSFKQRRRRLADMKNLMATTPNKCLQL